MTLSRSALLALAIGLVPVSAALAQWPSELAPGARVQVQLPEHQYQSDARRGHLVRGRVAAVTADTLYLAVADSLGPLAIPRPLVQRVDLSRGVPSRGASAIRRGIGGGISGALVGWAIGALDDDIDDGDAALIGGAIGFGTGALFGALFPRERWKKLKLTTVTSDFAGPRLGLAIGTTF
jgi:hypothetical protein